MTLSDSFKREALGAGIASRRGSARSPRPRAGGAGSPSCSPSARATAGCARPPSSAAPRPSWLRVLDVHELDADACAIGLLEDRQHLAQRGASSGRARRRHRWAGRSPRPRSRSSWGRARGGARSPSRPRGSRLAIRWPRTAVSADHHERPDRIDGLAPGPGHAGSDAQRLWRPWRPRSTAGRGRSRCSPGLAPPGRPLRGWRRRRRALRRTPSAGSREASSGRRKCVASSDRRRPVRRTDTARAVSRSMTAGSAPPRKGGRAVEAVAHAACPAAANRYVPARRAPWCRWPPAIPSP